MEYKVVEKLLTKISVYWMTIFMSFGTILTVIHFFQKLDPFLGGMIFMGSILYFYKANKRIFNAIYKESHTEV